MNKIPDPIVETLRQTIRRVRTVVIWRGVCAVTAVALGAFLLVMVADAVLILNAWWRYALSLPAYAVTVAAVVRFLLHPLAKTFSLSGMARIIEMNHPEMQERLSSSVELLLIGGNQRNLRGSEALINALAQEAARDAQSIRPTQEVSLRAATPFFLAAAGLILILAALFAALPRQTACLLARAAAPFLNLPNVYAVTMAISPGDAVIAAGDSVTLQVALTSPRPLGVTLRQLMDDGAVARHDLGRGRADAGLFEIAFTNVGAGFQYQIQAGNALSRLYAVKVIHPPHVQRVDLRYDYPPYAMVKPLLLKDAGGDILAMAGATVTVSAVLSQWVPSAVVRVERQTTNAAASSRAPPPAELMFAVTGLIVKAESNEVRGLFTWSMPPGLIGVWSIALPAKLGVAGAPFQRQIRAEPDQKPAVHILQPEQKKIQLNPADLLPVVFAASDDYGLTAVDLLLEADGKPRPPRRLWTLPEGAQAVTAAGSEAVLDMSGFPRAKQVKLRLQATDSLPPSFQGPQTGLSEICVITLGPTVAPFERRALDTHEQYLRNALEKIQAELISAKALAAPMPKTLAADGAIPKDAVAQLDRMRASLGAAESAARDASERLRGGYYTSFSDRLKDLADTALTRAESLTDQIKLADVPAQRGALAANVIAAIDQALSEVADMMKQFGLATAAMRDALDLDQMAREQKELAKAKLAMERSAPSAGNIPAMSSNEWKTAEDNIADRLAAMVRKDPRMARDIMGQARATVANSRAESQRLAERQARLAVALTNSAGDIQRRNKALQDLADRQKNLADHAAAWMPKPTVEPMRAIADAIKAGRLPEAIREQDRIVKALDNMAQRIAGNLPEETPAAQFPQRTPRQRSDAAARRAEEAARQAQEAVKAARGAEEQAQQRVERAQRLATPAAPPRDKSLGEETTRRLGEARQAAEAVKELARQTEDLANQSGQEAAQARSAADRAMAPNAPEPDSQQKTAEAEQSAQAAARHAEQAMRAAQQARSIAAEPEAPAGRGAAAAQMAEQSARRAQQAALQAQGAEQRMAQQVEQARQAELAARQAGDEQQAQQAAAQTDQKENAARQTGQAAQQAGQAAQDAKAAAQRSADSASSRESRQQAAIAERKAAEAAGHAAEAARAAQQAQEAAAQRTPQEMARQAAAMADQASQNSQRSAAAAQEAAQQAADNAQHAQQLAKAAQQEQQEDLAETLAEQAQQADQAHQNAQGALDNATRADKAVQVEAAKARQEAAEATQAAGHEAAAEKAQSAMQHAQEATRLAHQTREAAQQAQQEAAGGMPMAKAMDNARSAAKEAFQMAEEAKASAQEAARQAQQASQQAQEADKRAQEQGSHAKKGGEKGGEKGGQKSGEKGGEQGGKKGGEKGGEQSGEKSGQKGGEHKGEGKGGEHQGQGKGGGHKGQGKGQGQSKSGSGGGQSGRGTAEAASQAAQNAQSAAQQAAQAAQQAQQANTQAAQAPSLPGARRAAQQAQAAAQQAQQAALMAQENMRAARHAQAALQADAVGSLAEQQADVQAQALAMQTQQDQEFQQRRASAMAMLQEEQKGIAQKMSDALELANDMAPQLSGEASRALDMARQTADLMQQGQAAAARTQAGQAAAQMRRLAQQLEDTALAHATHNTDQPSPPAGNLIDAAQLADRAAARQQRLTDDLPIAARDTPMGPLAIQQNDLADQVADLNREAQLLKDYFGDLNISVPPQAPQAAGQLSQATTLSGQAAQYIKPLASANANLPADAAQLNLSQQTQRASLQALQQSSQSLGELGKALTANPAPAESQPSQQAQPAADTEAPASAPDQNLVNAYLQASQAAASGKGSDAIRMAQSLAGAAKAAAGKARKAGASPNMRGGGSDPNTRWDNRLTPLGEAVLRESFGSDMRDWKNLPSELRDEILQAHGAEGPEEYRLMIQRYFKEMLRHGAGAP